MPQRYRLMVQLAAWCALRFGELTELRRGDVDTKAGVLRIRRAVVLVDGRFVVNEPKSDAGIRDVNIPPHLLPIMREHLLTHTASGLDGLLFPSKNDPTQHMRQSALTRVNYPARKAAGRPDLRFHDLRHAGAVLAARTGATLAELMGRLGHSTSQAAMRYQSVAQDRDALIGHRLSEMTGWLGPDEFPTRAHVTRPRAHARALPTRASCRVRDRLGLRVHADLACWRGNAKCLSCLETWTCDSSS